MGTEGAELLAKILDAIFIAEFCPPEEKAEAEEAYRALLDVASLRSKKSVGLIKEAILRDRYPQYRYERLRSELGSIPPKLRDK
jgi:hypothetical protein